MAKQISLELLKQELASRNISYRMLSLKIELSPSQISLMFAGKRNMTVATLNKILDRMNVNIANLME